MAEFEIPTTLAEGTHPFEFPEEFKPITELLLVTSTPSTEPENPSAAIFVLYPHAGLIEVLPQKWFTPMKFNIGHQWITRVTRDPESHRIIGDGIRIGSFELTDDGKDLRRWIEEAATVSRRPRPHPTSEPQCFRASISATWRCLDGWYEWHGCDQDFI